MPSVTVVLSASLDAVLKQTAASHGRSVESVVNTALGQYLAWRDYSGSHSAIRIGNIELDPARRLVRKNSVLVRLTPTEFDLLHYLMVHSGLAMAHARILGAVWGVEYGGELEYLRTYVRHLRKKLEDDPAEPKYLLTDACYGYRFVDVTVDTNRATYSRPAEALADGPELRPCDRSLESNRAGVSYTTKATEDEDTQYAEGDGTTRYGRGAG